MTTIIFESHSTTFDNEQGFASGWNDVELSPLGFTQAKDLGERYVGNFPDVIVTSDLKRAVDTCQIAFGDKGVEILYDKRLRECDYGDLTQHPSHEVDPLKTARIMEPFPNGESYQDATSRVIECINEMVTRYEGMTIMIVGHRATQYGLELLVNKKPLKDIIESPWEWQPGWKYIMQ